MNYPEHVRKMLEHLVQNNNAKNVEDCINALCHAIVGVVAHSIPDHDAMHTTLIHLNNTMQRAACDLHDSVWQQVSHEEEPEEEEPAPVQPQPVDAETFLRDHFKPERFHG